MCKLQAHTTKARICFKLHWFISTILPHSARIELSGCPCSPLTKGTSSRPQPQNGLCRAPPRRLVLSPETILCNDDESPPRRGRRRFPRERRTGQTKRRPFVAMAENVPGRIMSRESGSSRSPSPARRLLPIVVPDPLLSVSFPVRLRCAVLRPKHSPGPRGCSV